MFIEDFEVDSNKYTQSGRIYNFCKYAINNRVILEAITISIVALVGSTGNMAYTDTASSSESDLGTGGPEYEMLGGEWSRSTTTSICDGQVFTLASGSEATLTRYKNGVAVGSTVQFDFIPLGDNAANVSYGRGELYELVLGDNSFEHLSLKDLKTDTWVNLWREEVSEDNFSGRIRIAKLLSTTTENTVIIEEKFNHGSATVFRLLMTVNGNSYVSAEMSVVNKEKYDQLYFGLIGSEKESSPSVYFPELRVCD